MVTRWMRPMQIIESPFPGNDIPGNDTPVPGPDIPKNDPPPEQDQGPREIDLPSHPLPTPPPMKAGHAFVA